MSILRQFLLAALIFVVVLATAPGTLGQNAIARTVKIKNGSAICTGVITSTNRVLTAYHCVDRPDGVKVYEKEATILRTNKDKDLALLKVETAYFNEVQLAEVVQTEDIHIWGFPFDSPNLVYATGVVMVVQFGKIYTSAILMAGGSGSGLWKDDKLAGICVSTMNRSGGLVSMAVPLEPIKEILNEQDP